MAYYLIISFVLFITIDYRFIYSLIDSKLLYSTPGSKINLLLNRKDELKTKKLCKIDAYVIIFFSLGFFLINYSVSSFIFNAKPLFIDIFYKKINLTEIMEGYESSFIIIYHFSCLICFFSLAFKYVEYIKKCISKILHKILKKYNENNIQIANTENIIARDENDECFCISDESLYQNLLITGSIGSGKTSGAISRITYNLIKSGKGGLILDAKGNFVDIVKDMCNMTGRQNELIILSKNTDYFFELLDNKISSLELSNRLKLVITLISPTNNSDSYWLDKVENVIMNLIVIMKYNKNLSIMELHKMVSQEDYLKGILNKIKKDIKVNVPNDKTSFELASSISFIENEFFKIDQRVNSIIKSEITRLTIPLITDYEIYNQFCKINNKNIIDFNNNKIVVLSLNIGENRALCKIISTFLKLSFQKYVLSKLSNPEPVFFIADEFQEFCNSEDAHFLSLSREAKCINVISTQSYSSLISNLKDKSASNVIIQNLVNKIWFRNDDNYTISEIVKQLGKINTIKQNTSISESGGESKKSFLKEGLRNKKSGITKALNFISVKENEYDENFFSRELKTFEALALVNTKQGIITKKVIFERWK